MAPKLTAGSPIRSTARNASTPSASEHAPAELLRRVPRQERGRARVEKILDAAASVIAEHGVDATTTNAIASRARTSVGSLYQFFPNKEAIVEALAARYNAELREINERALPLEAAFSPLAELVDHVVTPMLRFHIDNPAYRHIYHAMNGPEGPSCGEAELHKAVVARVETLLRVRAPGMRAETRHLHATVSVLTVHALLGFAVTASASTRDGIVRELKRLMVSYLETSIAHSPDAELFDAATASSIPILLGAPLANTVLRTSFRDS